MLWNQSCPQSQYWCRQKNYPQPLLELKDREGREEREGECRFLDLLLGEAERERGGGRERERRNEVVVEEEEGKRKCFLCFHFYSDY